MGWEAGSAEEPLWNTSLSQVTLYSLYSQPLGGAAARWAEDEEALLGGRAGGGDLEVTDEQAELDAEQPRRALLPPSGRAQEHEEGGAVRSPPPAPTSPYADLI